MSKENSMHKLVMDCIYQALVQLMDEKEYRDITITDITQKAGVSRMAYYRNFKEKDDILINHLKKVLESEEARISEKNDLMKEDFWRHLLLLIRDDPINEHILRAGLFEKSFRLHLRFAMRLYQRLYEPNMMDENSVILVYRHLGALFGCMFYLIDNKESVSTDTFVEHLTALAGKEL